MTVPATRRRRTPPPALPDIPDDIDLPQHPTHHDFAKDIDLHQLPERNYIAPDLLLDKYHPANTRYMQQIQSMRELVHFYSKKLSRPHLHIVRLHLMNHTPKDIANETGLVIQTIYRVLQRPEVKTLIATMRHLEMALRGPSEELRKRKLWEIVIDTEEDDKKTAILAIREINNMEGTGKPHAQEKGDQTVTVVINQAILPPGPLDV